ncbi:MAG: hypothetical protein D6715_05025 [Calditrichaeota bacterium]|nr:MAG: hypothetical protein D6715_05025 [Calditrichota bacterium]
MGSRQLLLIVLVLILVAIAVASGLYMFQTNAIESNRRMLVTELMGLGAKAQRYYRMPVSLGGGGRSFNGFALTFEDTASAVGRYRLSTTRPSGASTVIGSTQAIAVNTDSIFIVGSGRERGNDKVHPTKAFVKVTPEKIEAFTLN